MTTCRASASTDRAATPEPVASDRASRAADRLNLAAAPAFAVMALVSMVTGDDPSTLVCSTAYGTSWLTGMTSMYVLMSTFHLEAWLRRISKQPRAPARSRSRPA